MLYFITLALLVALGAGSMWATGSAFERLLRIDYGSRALACIVGLAAIGTMFVWLLLAGQFATPAVAIVLGSGLVGGAWLRLRSPTFSWAFFEGLRINPARFAAVAVIVAMLVWLTLYPYRGYDFRAYQYPMAQGYATTGAWQWFEHLRFPTFPPLVNLWMAAAILLGGEAAPVLAQVWALIPLFLTAALLIHWARELGAPVPAWAAAALLGSPLIVWAGTFTFVETTLMAFTTAAIYCLQRFHVAQENRASHQIERALLVKWQWLALSGVLVGAAMNTKYLGAFFAPFIMLWLTGDWLRARSGAGGPAANPTRAPSVRALATTIAAFIVPAFAVAAPWYIRTWVETGNPTFPFLKSVFGSNPWGWQVPSLTSGVKRGVSNLGGGFLTWDAYNPWLVPVVLVATALLLRRGGHLLRPSHSPSGGLRGAISDRRLGLIELAGCSYFLTLAIIGNDRRYLLPAVALFSLLAGVYFGALRTWIERKRVATTWSTAGRLFLHPVTFGLLLGILGLGFAAHKLSEVDRLPPTQDHYEAYLLDNLHGLETLRWIQSHEKPAAIFRLGLLDLTALAQGERQFGDVMGAYSHRRFFGVGRDASGVVTMLDSMQATMLLVDGCESGLRRRTRYWLARNAREDGISPVPEAERRRQIQSVVSAFEEVYRSNRVCAYRVLD